MEIFLVAIGGSLGSLTRFRIGKLLLDRSLGGRGAGLGNGIPLGTFFVNITGAILLGFLSGFYNYYGDSGVLYYRIFGDGFLGAYTTFSTFMYEGFNYFQESKALNAIVYILVSLALGVAGFTTGYFLARVACG